ncbi:hypothetical protein [Hymenobacter sp. CRA2]|uniref:hypothetical protein n=1 Tax=Hymenobacter sp. CRA2 TaxID=1955620 RepID=UPI00098F9A72|nr:hypothetical protein [Hymenobacter sp. CRA2]OON71119.1 hypothetical protein B0919_03775 [Hymenobacter sp. CRA2]
MKTTFSLLALLATVSVLSTSCKKSAPTPKESYALTHEFSTVLGVTPAETERTEQPTSKLIGTAQVTDDALSLTIAVPEEEELVLRIDQDRLAKDYVGQYFLRGANDRSGAADVTYSYSFASGSARQTRVYDNQPGSPGATSGFVQITAYDPGSALISGIYHVQLAFVPQPKAPVTVTAPLWQITLEGKFNNAKLTR